MEFLEQQETLVSLVIQGPRVSLGLLGYKAPLGALEREVLKEIKGFRDQRDLKVVRAKTVSQGPLENKGPEVIKERGEKKVR